MRDRETIRSAVKDYAELHRYGDYIEHPTWYDVLSYLAGYFGEITVDMVIVVRQMQMEGVVQ